MNDTTIIEGWSTLDEAAAVLQSWYEACQVTWKRLIFWTLAPVVAFGAGILVSAVAF